MGCSPAQFGGFGVWGSAVWAVWGFRGAIGEFSLLGKDKGFGGLGVFMLQGTGIEFWGPRILHDRVEDLSLGCKLKVKRV